MTTPDEAPAQPAKRGFVLADAVEPLDFDLTPHGPRGTVPEPSQQVIDDWNVEMARIGAENRITLQPNSTSVEIAAAIVERAEHAKGLNERALAAYARLCGGKDRTVTRNKKQVTVWEGGSPTYDELVALPWRAQAAFFGWLTGEMNPETGPAATRS